MRIMRKSMLIGAGAVTIGLAGLSGAGIASAASSTTSPGGNTLVDKIANTFHLDKSKVQAVFDQNRQTHQAEWQAKRTAALDKAVADGKITQAQADHITAVWKQNDDLRGTTTPGAMSSTTRNQIKQNLDELHAWLQQQNINLRSLGVRAGMGHGHGFGGRGAADADDQATGSSTNTATN